MKILLLFLFCILTFTNASFSQKIIYTTEDDLNLNGFTDFNIMGKINEKYFIYFHHAPASYIYVYNAQMKHISTEKLQLQKNYFGMHFINYKDFVYIFYQYTQANHVFCKAAKIDSNGKMNKKPVTLSEITLKDYYSHSSIYNLAYSEDKKKIAIFTVHETEDAHLVKLLILDQYLNLIQNRIFRIPLMSNYESFSDFKIDNEGNFIFLKKDLFDNSDPYKYVINFIGNNSTTLSFFNITPTGIRLNKFVITIDNSNNILNFFAFYIDSSLSLKALWDDIPISKAISKSGLFNATWDIKNKRLTNAATISFHDFLDTGLYNSDLTQLPIQSFIITGVYNFKRTYLLLGENTNPYNPYRQTLTPNGNWQYQGLSVSGYLYYPDFDFYFPRTGNSHFDFNILLLSLDSTGRCTKFNFINELQATSFMSMSTVDAIHYFFIHKMGIDYQVYHTSYTNDGEVHTRIPLKNIGNYQFDVFGYKQVSETELIFPVRYNGRLNFAKIEF